MMAPKQVRIFCLTSFQPHPTIPSGPENRNQMWDNLDNFEGKNEILYYQKELKQQKSRRLKNLKKERLQPVSEQRPQAEEPRGLNDQIEPLGRSLRHFKRIEDEEYDQNYQYEKESQLRKVSQKSSFLESESHRSENHEEMHWIQEEPAASNPTGMINPTKPIRASPDPHPTASAEDNPKKGNNIEVEEYSVQKQQKPKRGNKSIPKWEAKSIKQSRRRKAVLCCQGCPESNYNCTTCSCTLYDWKVYNSAYGYSDPRHYDNVDQNNNLKSNYCILIAMCKLCAIYFLLLCQCCCFSFLAAQVYGCGGCIGSCCTRDGFFCRSMDCICKTLEAAKNCLDAICCCLELLDCCKDCDCD